MTNLIMLLDDLFRIYVTFTLYVYITSTKRSSSFFHKKLHVHQIRLSNFVTFIRLVRTKTRFSETNEFFHEKWKMPSTRPLFHQKRHEIHHRDLSFAR